MQSTILFPSPHLSSVILCYEFYDIRDNLGSDFQIVNLPGFYAGLIFLFYRKKPLIAINKNLKGNLELPPNTIIPPTRLPTYNYQIQDLSLIRVIGYPGFMSRLYDIPAYVVENEIIDSANDLDRELHFLYEQLAEAHNPYVQVQYIETYLLKKLRFQYLDKDFFGIVNQILPKLNPHPSVKELANELGISTRHLSRLSNKVIGFPISDVIRIHRLHRILKYFQYAPQISLTEVAYRFAYYDQAHFNRDFKRLTDHSPKAYLKSLGKEGKIINYSDDNLEYGGFLLKG